VNKLAAIVIVGMLAACSSSAKESVETSERADTTVEETTGEALAADTTTVETKGETTVATEPVETDPAETDTPTTEDPAATDAPTTTEAPPTTGAAATEGFGLGLVWKSGVDPSRVNVADGQPVGDAPGVHSSIDLILLVDQATNDGCAQSIDFHVDVYGGDRADRCLIVQFRFDVAADATDSPSDQVNFVADPLVTGEGRQVETSDITGAYPGTVDNQLVVAYPFGGAGSVIRWHVSGLKDFSIADFIYTVPPIEMIPPLTFDPNS